MSLDAGFWQQFSAQQPRLRQDLVWQAQEYRGEAWTLLRDPLSDQFFRCPAQVAQFLKTLDGKTRIAEALAHLPETEQPDQEELLRLLTMLQERHLLEQGLDQQLQDRLAQRHIARKKIARQRWLMPLSIRLPLWNPDRFLQRWRMLWPGIFNRAAAMVVVLLLVIAFALAQEQSEALKVHWQSRFMDTSNLLWFWLLYPPIKLLHELGHAAAVSRWGGRVHELGVMLLVLMPVPYVDASASYAFANKYQRMLVAGAGIIVELLCAALAMILWWQAETGLWRDLCFNVMVIAGVSTLLINGNPLLKFDGYHVLAEYLEMPNLASRSQTVVRGQWARFLLRSPDVMPVKESVAEQRIAFCYGYASALYRLVIACSIIWFVAGAAFFIGMFLAIGYVLQQWFWPLYKGLAFLWQQAIEMQRRAVLLMRVAWVSLAIIACLIWPWQGSTTFDAVASLPENAAVRVGSGGMVHAMHVAAGDWIEVGQKIAQLHNPDLEAEKAALLSRIDEINQRRQALSLREELARQILQNEQVTLNNELKDLQSRIDSLEVISPAAGRFQSAAAQSWLGRYLKQGEVLGFVFSPEGVTLSAVVSQQVMPRLQSEGGSSQSAYEARFIMRPENEYSLQLEQEVPGMSRQLPGALLGSEVQLDARDTSGRTATEAVYHLRFKVPGYDLDTLAARAIIRAEHEPVSLLSRLLGALRRLWWQHEARSE